MSMLDAGTLCYCCGAWELGEFPFDGDFQENATALGYSEADVLEAIEEQLAEAREGSRGVIIATTVPRQTIAAKLLQRKGFQQLLQFKGRYEEGSKVITLWAKVLKPVETRKQL